MKKIKYINIIIVIIVILICCITLYKDNNICDIHEVVSIKLDNEYIKKSYIKKLGNYNNINYINISYDISEEELNQRIGDILESYDELVQVSDLKVDSDDVISIDIKITNKDDIIYQEKDILLNMKNFSYDEELKNYIIGCKVKKDYKFQWKVPKEQQYEDIAGNMVDVYLFINSIYEYIQYDLNDEFVVQKLGYKNTSEFVNDLKKEMEVENAERAYVQESYIALNQVVKESDFNMDKDEMLEYALHYVEQYQDIAEVSNMSFVEYGKKSFGFSEEEFYEYCYKEAETEIKQYLVIGAIAKENNIDITNKMLQEYCDEHTLNMEMLDEKYKNEIKCQILTDKVFELMRREGTFSEKN